MRRRLRICRGAVVNTTALSYLPQLPGKSADVCAFGERDPPGFKSDNVVGFPPALSKSASARGFGVSQITTRMDIWSGSAPEPSHATTLWHGTWRTRPGPNRQALADFIPFPPNPHAIADLEQDHTGPSKRPALAVFIPPESPSQIRQR